MQFASIELGFFTKWNSQSSDKNQVEMLRVKERESDWMTS
jgi:hypothetical protein